MGDTYKNGDPEDKLVEECGETLQALAKAKRFGYFNFHPDRPDSTNIEELRKELDDLIESAQNMHAHLDTVERIRSAFLPD